MAEYCKIQDGGKKRIYIICQNLLLSIISELFFCKIFKIIADMNRFERTIKLSVDSEDFFAILIREIPLDRSGVMKQRSVSAGLNL